MMKKSAPRRALIAGNWKMHATRAEAVALIDSIKEAAGARDREVVIAPPYTALETAARVTAHHDGPLEEELVVGLLRRIRLQARVLQAQALELRCPDREVR